MLLGWDGAEVTSFTGHLIEQFFDPSVNDRTDRYGGSLENRVRFAREVLTAAGDSRLILSFRMTSDVHPEDYPADLREIARATAGGTVDVLSIGNGTGYSERTGSVFVPGDELSININGANAGLMRRATGVPVLVAGRILDPATAERALTEDSVDLRGHDAGADRRSGSPAQGRGRARGSPLHQPERTAASAASTRAGRCGAR